MYSEKVISRTLDDFARREGWRPVFHSVEECDEFTAYVDSIVDVDANSRSKYLSWKPGKRPTEPRIKWINQWVRNEQYACFASADYFVTRYGKLRDAEERVIHFSHRIAQRIFHNALAECDDLQIAIQLYILKCRQLGISSVVAQYFLHRILFRSNTYAVMASVQAQQSEKLAAMIDLTWTRLPFWLPPRKTILKAKEPKWENGSLLSVQSGTQEVGIAQGSTPTCLVPSSSIRLANGLVVPISKVGLFTKAITHSGVQANIAMAWKTERGEGPTVAIKLRGNYEELECSPDHLILTPDGWQSAENLSVGDFVRHPVRKISEGHNAFCVRHLSRGNGKKEDINVPLGFNMGYVSGLYLAEGSIHNAKNISETVFTIHARERAHRKCMIDSVLDGRWKVSERKHMGNGFQLKVYCSWLARWLSENFGRREEKRLPDWVFDTNTEFCKGLLKGFFDGDGHLETTCNHVRLATVHRGLALQYRDLIASLGLGWSSIYYKEACIYRGMRKKPVWWLVLVGPTGAAYRNMIGLPFIPPTKGPARNWKQADGYIDIKIKSVREGWSKEFWDLAVEHNDHSFTTTQCAVHNCIHISEVGDYANPKRVLEEGLFPACHPTKSLFMVLEGTGATSNTWQKEKWDYYSQNHNKGGRFRPFFIPPACARDLYPHADWLRAHPIPGPWMPTDETRRMRRRAELFVRSTDYLWKMLGQHWEMDREFMWYWECLYQEAVASHSEREFLAQYAPTPEDAFQSANDPVFSKETIDVVTKSRQRKYKAYAVTGRTILMGDENVPYKPNPEDVDSLEYTIPLRWEANDGNTYEWELIPLKDFDDSTDEACFDKLLIFEPPEPGAEYAIAIDTAHGLNTPNEDRSALSVHRDGKGVDPDVQVASFTSIRVTSPQMARISAAIAVLFGTDGEGNVTSADPLIAKFVIEQIRKPGDECQHQLKIMGFLNHHLMHWYDSKGNIDPNKGTKEGWRTTSWSRPILIDRFIEAVNTGWLVLNNPVLIRELEKFVRKHKGQGGKPFCEHEEGAHDDQIFSAAMGWTTLKDLENTSIRLARKFTSPKKEEKINDAWASRTMILD